MAPISRSRRPALAALVGTSLVSGLLLASPAAAAEVPGVTLRTFATGPLTSLCTLKEGQTPNYDKVMPTIDWTTAEQFGQEDNFLSQVTSTLTAPTTGQYVFRLTSDDGSRMSLDGTTLVDHDGLHAATSVEGTTTLTAGPHALAVDFFEAGFGQQLKLEWRTPGSTTFQVVPSSVLSTESAVGVTSPGTKYCEGATDTAGDGLRLDSVNPGYDLAGLRPPGFDPMVSGLAWLDADTMLVLTSGAVSPSGPPQNPTPGELFAVEGVVGADGPEDVTYTKLATDLVTPMGVTVVDGTVYVSEKYGMTVLTPDSPADADAFLEKRTLTTWKNGGNFHEFAFGLLHDEDYLYVSRSVAINNGGATTEPAAGHRRRHDAQDRPRDRRHHPGGGRPPHAERHGLGPRRRHVRHGQPGRLAARVQAGPGQAGPVLQPLPQPRRAVRGRAGHPARPVDPAERDRQLPEHAGHARAGPLRGSDDLR